VLLELPLQADKRWGGEDGPPRQDGWYCWRVETKKLCTLDVIGLPPDEYFSTYSVAFRTNPGHQVMDIVPGVGITHLEYEHHGTVGSEDVRLLRFDPPAGKPRPRSLPAGSH
jgi:hypothetical protein